MYVSHMLSLYVHVTSHIVTVSGVHLVNIPGDRIGIGRPLLYNHYTVRKRVEMNFFGEGLTVDNSRPLLS